MSIIERTPTAATERGPAPRRPRPLSKIWPPALAIAASIGLWWLASSVLSEPHSLLRQTAPHKAIPAVIELLDRGVLLPDIGISLWRLLIGLSLGALVGIPVGLLLGVSTTAERAARPVIQFLRMISPLSWTPIAVAVFGIGSQPVIFLIAAAAVWPIIINTTAGVHGIEPGYLHVARSFHATRIELLTAVVLPSIRGHIQTGVRIALGIAWVVLVPAEMLGVRSGLGYQILNARDQLAYDQVVAVILVIGLLGYALDLLARRLLAAPRNRAAAAG